jgi:hypothetical protein
VLTYTPRSGVSACRGGSPCTPRICISTCRGGRGCTPRSCASPCRADTGCTPRSCASPCRADTGCTPHSCFSPFHASTVSLPTRLNLYDGVAEIPRPTACGYRVVTTIHHACIGSLGSVRRSRHESARARSVVHSVRAKKLNTKRLRNKRSYSRARDAAP